MSKIEEGYEMCRLLGRAFGRSWGVQFGQPIMPSNIYYDNSADKENADIVLCHDKERREWILLCDGEPYVTELVEAALERART